MSDPDGGTEVLREKAHLFHVPAVPSGDGGPSSSMQVDATVVASRQRSLSFVIPLFDEQSSLWDLYHGIANAAAEVAEVFEVVFVDDGSRDDSWKVVCALRERWPARVLGIRLRRNLGKAAALRAGFEAARGEIVFTLDADLQDDPKEIPRFIETLDQGYDIVCGWKRKRHDPWHKVFPSRVFNRVLSRVSGVALHDHNTGFKCYRREVVDSLQLMGEMHRMLPALAGMHGFRSTEIPVEHHPRRHGRSKYGTERIWRGACDLLTVAFLRRYRERPLHLVAWLAGGCLMVSMGSLVGGSTLLDTSVTGGSALLIVGALFFVTSVLLAVIGLLSELMLRTRLRGTPELPVAERTAALPAFETLPEPDGEDACAA